MNLTDRQYAMVASLLVLCAVFVTSLYHIKIEHDLSVRIKALETQLAIKP